MAKKTFIVNHKNLYLRVDNKLQRVKSGAEISMEAKHAASLCKQGKLSEKGKTKQITVGVEPEAEIDPKADPK